MPTRRPDAWRLAGLGLRLGLGLIPLYVMLSILLAALPGPRAVMPQDGARIEVRLVSGPIHYDFLLPADAITKARFEFTESAGVPVSHPQVAWIVVGWGARDFYTTVGSYLDVTPRAVWRGLTGDGSVMHVDVAGALPPDLAARRLVLSEAQYAALLDAILADFARGDTGAPRGLPTRYGPTDAFFEAEGRFDVIRTCNAWVGQVLRSAGLRFGLWTPLPYSVSLSHWLWQSSG